MKSEAERLRELLAVNRAITAAEDFDVVLRLVVDKACALTDGNASLLLLAEPGAAATVVASAGVAADAVADFHAELDETIARALRERLGLGASQEILAVPMIVGVELRGILVVVRVAEGAGGTRAGSAEELLLSALADQAAIALRQAAHVGELRAALSTAEQLTERLRRSEAHIRDLLELAPDAFFLATLDGRYVDVNQAACHMLGYTADELRGMTIFDLVPVEQAARLRAERTHLLHPGRVMKSEWLLRRKDGTFLPVEVSSNSLPDGRWQAFVRDISARKQALAALRFSEARFSGIISVSADAIISIDENQRITLFNKGAETMFGWAAAEILGEPLDLLIPERLRARHREHVARFAAGAVQSRRMGERVVEILGLRKNGDEFPAEAAISRLAVEGRTTLTVAVRHVSEPRRFAREQHVLAEAGARFSASLDYGKTLTSVGDLVVRELADWCIIDVVDSTGRVRRLKVVSADPRHAALAARFEALELDRSRPHLMSQVLASERPFLAHRLSARDVDAFAQSPEQLEILRAIAPRSLMGVPLLTQGRLCGALLLISTRPSRVYGPDDLAFAAVLAERATLAIENGRLYREALHATQLRDEVLGVVAHDLRNPVSSILMHCQVALRGRAVSAEVAFERIERAARRASRLIEDLLDISTIESGHLSLDRAPLPVARLVSDAVETQRLLVGAASLELELALPPQLPDIVGDAHRLQQVLENLIGNATKFTPPGGHIIVGAAPSGRDVRFWVADSGRGISPELLSHVFDRFWQEQRGDHRGAGLGLPISRGIVEAHGGRIWVESTPGEGATFYFTIPQAPAVPLSPSHSSPQP